MLNNCSYYVLECSAYTRGTSVFPDIYLDNEKTQWQRKHFLFFLFTITI